MSEPAPQSVSAKRLKICFRDGAELLLTVRKLIELLAHLPANGPSSALAKIHLVLQYYCASI